MSKREARYHLRETARRYSSALLLGRDAVLTEATPAALAEQLEEDAIDWATENGYVHESDVRAEIERALAGHDSTFSDLIPKRK